MSEEKAVAIMMANLKRAKSSNLLEFAQACRVLKNKWGIPEMSKYFKTSQYMLRQIDKINELSPSLQKLVKEGKLKIESSYHIWRLPESKRQIVADMIQKMSSNEIRDFVHYIHKNPDNLDKAKKLYEKNRSRPIRLLVLPLTDETFDKLNDLAKKSKASIHDFALKILENFVYEKKKK